MIPVSLISGLATSDALAKVAEAANAAPSVSVPKVGGSFLDALGNVATNAIGTLERSESLSLDALKGEADTREVVDAVMSAEQSLQTAIAIRDKIVSAYLEVSRMAI
jgi:flagellar hook-basal body complex protein FliE